jgi:hypothetical protein
MIMGLAIFWKTNVVLQKIQRDMNHLKNLTNSRKCTDLIEPRGSGRL